MTETMTPFPRKRHKVVIEFEIDVAPEVALKIRDSIGRNMLGLLGYPTDALGQGVYSFNRPDEPKEVQVSIMEVADATQTQTGN